MSSNLEGLARAALQLPVHQRLALVGATTAKRKSEITAILETLKLLGQI